jgi:hypothetical protein
MNDALATTVDVARDLVLGTGAVAVAVVEPRSACMPRYSMLVTFCLERPAFPNAARAGDEFS